MYLHQNVPVAKHTTVVMMLLQNVPHDNCPDFAKSSVSKQSSFETDLLLKSQVHSLGRIYKKKVFLRFELCLSGWKPGVLSTELFWQITLVDQVAPLNYVLGLLRGFA